MNALLPRLKNIHVQSLLDDYAKDGVPQPHGNISDIERNSYYLNYAASGGNVDNDMAVSIANGIRQIALENAYPKSRSKKDRASFDCDASAWLACEPGLMSGEALRDDVWACLTTVLAPDVVAWRFPDLNDERFSGGVRNTFQRLWMRGMALDRGQDSDKRWQLLHELTEDAMGAIFERPGLSGNRVLAKAIAEAWLETKVKLNNTAMEDIMRCAAKVIRLKNEVVDLSVLSADDLRYELRDAFRYAVGQIKGIDTIAQLDSDKRGGYVEEGRDETYSDSHDNLKPAATLNEAELDEVPLVVDVGRTGVENLIELSEKAAFSLAKYGGALHFSSLRYLTDDAAIGLSIHKGDLWLDGLTELSDVAAEALALHIGRLSLSGLKEITDTAAEALSRHQGGLYLLGLTNLSEHAAKWLSSYQGELDLPLSIGVRFGLVEIPDDY
jgi:hypothetical protein